MKNPFGALARRFKRPAAASAPERSRLLRVGSIAAGITAALLLVLWVVGWFWSWEPGVEDVEIAELDSRVTGYATVETLIEVTRWLLDKPGGYLSNDVAPPGVWLDNMPNFEFGVLVQCRDLARVLRNDYSRSQSQSTEDADLAVAEPALNFSNDSWIFPPSENRYRDAIEALESYRGRLVAPGGNARFFARSDNLREWLAVVERRLGSLSQRLSASVGQPRFDTSMAGDRAARMAGSPAADGPAVVQTPWLEIDDVFYEARGTAWALVQFLHAAADDFENVLEDKNAVVSIRQIIRELEGGLAPIDSPVILNGKRFGLLANHSLVLASYLSRAHAAVIDVRELLEQG